MNFRAGALNATDAARLNEMFRELALLRRMSVAAPLSLSKLAGVPVISLSGGETDTWKAPVRVASTASGTLATAFEAGDTLDGVTLVTGDRILLKDQTSATENGIYVVSATGAPTRAADADTGAELLGATVAVTEGTANADTVWLCTANATITVGSTNLPWVKVGPGISVTGTDNHALRMDGTAAAQDSAVTIDDNGLVSTSGASGGYSYSVSGETLSWGQWSFSGSLSLIGFNLANGLFLGYDNTNHRLVLQGDRSTFTPKFSIVDATDTYRDGFTGTCTVKVAGVDKTLRVMGGIVWDIS